jgi:DNA-binding NtrC family response regulator
MNSNSEPDPTCLNLIGASPQFASAVARMRRIAQVDAAVLIEGETGTGKELVARAMHYLGPRAGQPFVPINCGALAENIVESELFGHRRGAFTDAKTDAAGLISEADGGTLFLDEVDALPAKAQAALLRFLQDKTFRPVGGGAMKQADLRIIAASNADLEQLANTRQFRGDLFYRLSVLRLRMPALRERDNDVLELAQAFLGRLNHQYHAAPAKQLHPEFIEFIRHYAWPGNVRELENLIQREFFMSSPEENWLRLAPETEVPAIPADEPTTGMPFKTAKAHAIAEFELRYVSRLLEKTSGNITHAARLAGQDRSAFNKLVLKHGISHGDFLSPQHSD